MEIPKEVGLNCTSVGILIYIGGTDNLRDNKLSPVVTVIAAFKALNQVIDI